MKKITLSAAVVALAMMGCSDAGLDNSVASTSEVTDVQNQYSADFVPVLKKETNTMGCDGVVNSACFYRSTVHNGKSYLLWAWSGKSTNENVGKGKIWVQMRDQKGRSIPTVADMVHIRTVSVCDCQLNGVELVCQDHKENPDYWSAYRFNLVNVNSSEYPGKIAWLENHTKSVQCIDPSSFGTVSSFAVVLNGGTSDETVLMGNTYYGFNNAADMNYLAARVYQKYIIEPILGN